MQGMAKAFLMGIERSARFVEVFTRGLEGEDWYARPAGVPNPAIWTLGHIAYHRGLFYEMVTGERTYPEPWKALFDMGCTALGDPHGYPGVEECLAYMERTLGLWRTYLESASDEELAASTPSCVPRLPTRAAVLSHCAVHESHHTGSLAIARRLLGKDRVV
ncbi:MAG TPA: DinB family protein [Thermoanaerobaculaceae bacterium]|nr:DinB family protein [Thermoanaerobaculaceae bacterium]